MSQKNETPVLILSLLITAALLGAGGWWFLSRLQTGSLPELGNLPSATGGTSSGNPGGSVESRLSVGDRLLLPEGASADKQAGVEAIAAGNFDQAISRLEATLQSNRNDPEALIYLNNARIGTGQSYAIAVAVPITTSTNPALEILRGVAQAQDELNRAGGINGVPIKVIIVNDDNNPDTAKQVATALVADTSVLAVIGHFGSDATLAAAPIYEQGGLVMISPTSTSTKLSELGDYTFRTVPSDRFTAAALSRYILNTLQKQNAVVYFNSGSDYSNSLKDEFSTALATDGGQVLSEFDLSNANFDAAESLEQATQQQAEVIVLLANTATLDQALQVVAVNRKQLPLVGGDSLYNPKTLQVGGDNAEGMAVAVPWLVLTDPQSPFAKSSRQYWGGDVNWRTATAYDAMQALATGLQSDATRAGLNQALLNSNFSTRGASGTIRFLPSGDRNQAMQLAIVEPGRRSGFGFDFVPAGR